MPLDIHRRVALWGLGVMSILTWISLSVTMTGFIGGLPGSGLWLFLLGFVQAGAILIYSLLITVLVLGGTSHQLQYLAPAMVFVGLVIYLIINVP